MKFILKDINKPKSEIYEKKVGDVRMSALVSGIIFIIFFYDLSRGGFMLDVFLETNGTAMFATPLIARLIIILVFISCISDILRYLFMELEKDFSFINPNIFAILLAILLILNIIISKISGREIDTFDSIFTLIIVALVFIQIYKENKKQKKL